MGLSTKHRKTLAAVFETPTRPNVKWARVEALVRALGGTVNQRSGSRVAFALNGVDAVFHTPHPAPDAKRGAVRAVAAFFESAGVGPS